MSSIPLHELTLGQLLTKAIDMSGTKFGMSYEEQRGYWNFYNSYGLFESESLDVAEALVEYLEYLGEEA